MASSRDAFSKFSMWKNSRTPLNLTVVTHGRVERFRGTIFHVDELDLLVGFADDATRVSKQLDFSGDGISFAVESGKVEVTCLDLGRVTFVEALAV
jgi:hypothetical protein